MFDFGFFQLHTYGALIALGFLLTMVWLVIQARRWQEPSELYLNALCLMVLFGFSGARLLHVGYFPDYYLQAPMRILFERGGLVWYGGFIAGALTLMVYAKAMKRSVLKFCDVFIIPTSLTLALGRLGCFMTGCCYGRPCTLPWAVHFPPGHETYPQAVHPTQLYESISVFLLSLFLIMFYRAYQSKPGQTLSVFLMAYGPIRFVVEHFRGDGLVIEPTGLTISQLISIIMVIIGVGLWSMSSKRHVNKPSDHQHVLL